MIYNIPHILSQKLIKIIYKDTISVKKAAITLLCDIITES